VRVDGCAQVIESKSSKFKVGDLISGLCKWQTLVVFHPDDKDTGIEFQKIPGHLDYKRMLSMTTSLNAYFGLLEIVGEF